jgi:hypothetical protein
MANPVTTPLETAKNPHTGYTPGLLQSATGITPSARENMEEAEAEGGSGSGTTATGYATLRRWSAGAVVSESYGFNLEYTVAPWVYQLGGDGEAGQFSPL